MPSGRTRSCRPSPSASTLPITLGANGSFTTNVNEYKTLVLPFEADVPAGFTASKAASVSGTTINLEAVSTINADAPVILQGEGALEITATNATISATPEDAPTNGLLQGTYKSTPAPLGSYVLQKQNDVIGFYHVEDDITVGAFRAWLNAPESSVKALYIGNSGATGIASPIEETGVGTAIYNLSGQRLSKPQKGINLSKKKKILFNKD